MRLSTIFLIVLALSTLLLASCDTGEVCDDQGNCEPAAAEDRATLESYITEEIGTNKITEESP